MSARTRDALYGRGTQARRIDKMIRAMLSSVSAIQVDQRHENPGITVTVASGVMLDDRYEITIRPIHDS